MSSTEEEEEQEYEVEAITGQKGFGIRMKYLVKWKGYETPTWEPAANCEDCEDLIVEFLNSRNAAKASSATRQRNRTTTASATARKRSRTVARRDSTPSSPKKDATPPSSIPSSNRRRHSRKRAADKDSSDEEEKHEENKKQKIGKSPSNSPRTPRAGTTIASQRTPRSTTVDVSRNLRAVDAERPPSSQDSFDDADYIEKSSQSSASSAPKSATKKSPAKDTKSKGRLTRVADAEDLDFAIKKIEGVENSGGTKKLFVTTSNNKTETVDVKAAAKQNVDLVLDFLMDRI